MQIQQSTPKFKNMFAIQKTIELMNFTKCLKLSNSIAEILKI